ncbi:hypothetical protein MMC14_007819 [Varicellaria rhodocarpa]|nr:hypothetical protein [Varicellaria rhodocarpa]
MSKAQFPGSDPTRSSPASQTSPPLTLIADALLASSPTSPHDIHLSPLTKKLTGISQHGDRQLMPSTLAETTITATRCLALPSLCHPHIHLDKANLYSSPLYNSLRPRSGSFHEALSLSAAAKERYTHDDLLQRGNWLIAESVAAGVTHMRAFVEVDTVVQTKCVQAGVELKKWWEGKCDIQLCLFSQEAVFRSPSQDGSTAEEEEQQQQQSSGNKQTMEEAIETYPAVEAIGSTPYVESSPEKAKQNIDWIVALAITKNKHLDLHLDYTLNTASEPLIWYLLSTLHRLHWTENAAPGKTICLGHCTRLTLFSSSEWKRLKTEMRDLPISFIGLPTSDLFMMGRPNNEESWRDRPRGTLQVPWLIKELGVNAAIGVNNVGNAFTPQGSADPLSVAGLGVGLYQAGTGEDAEVLYVSHIHEST